MAADRTRTFPIRWDTLAFAGLVLLWIWQCAVLLQPELRFTADAERDLFSVRGLLLEGQLPEDGIRMGVGVDLGPLYHLLIAPVVAVWPSPQSVMWFNLVICVVGLIAWWAWLRREWGPVAALIGCLLYTQSAGHVAMVGTIWHNGAAPGVAMLSIAAMAWWARSGRLAALLLSGIALSVLAQLHGLGLTYVPAALVLLWLGREHLDRRRLGLLAAVVTAASTLLLIYAVQSLGNPSDTAGRHGGEFGFSPGEAALGLVDLLGPRYLVGPVWGGRVVLLLALLGVVGTFLRHRWGERRPHRWFVLLQALIGFGVVSVVISYDHVGRYYLPLLYPVFALVAMGVGEVDDWAITVGRRPLGRALAWGALLLSLRLVQPPTVSLDTDALRADNLDYLTASEQETVVAFLTTERGLKWPAMRTRLHGLAYGSLTGIRYLESIYRDQAARETPDGHWLVLPATHPAPEVAERAFERVILPGTGRKLALYRYPPRIDPGAVRTADGVPCPYAIPYLWTQVPEELLKALGFGEGYGPDIHVCLARSRTLVLPVAPEAAGLMLQLSDDAHFRDGVELREILEARIEAEDARPLPLALTPWVGVDKIWVQIPVPLHDGKREVHLTIKTPGPLGFFDIY